MAMMSSSSVFREKGSNREKMIRSFALYLIQPNLGNRQGDSKCKPGGSTNEKAASGEAALLACLQAYRKEFQS
jgi:hypothetical protein